jgi:N-acyl homoserine lactone hydrolase
MMKQVETGLERLYILDFGLFEVHENGRQIGIPGYLIQTRWGENILVDSGFPAAYATNGAQAAAADQLDTFGRVLHLTEENLPAAQLAHIGLTSEAITHFILTHSDIDHVGGIADFADAPLIIGAAERKLARPRYFATQPLAWPDVAYRRIEQATELVPGLTLLPTPGHSPGHLSLLLQLPETGALLLTGDAISRPAEFDEGFGGAWDAVVARQSAEQLMAIAKAHNAFVIYGHDPAQWPTLRKAPLFYD